MHSKKLFKVTSGAKESFAASQNDAAFKACLINHFASSHPCPSG